MKIPDDIQIDLGLTLQDRNDIHRYQIDICRVIDIILE
jgi:hypothetical protein